MGIATGNKNNVIHTCMRYALRGIVIGLTLLFSVAGYGQEDVKVTTRIDANKITVGDQARLFLEVQSNPSSVIVHWPQLPDSFDHLEIVEKGKIDTVKQGGHVLYKQRLLITGFDSGVFKIPSFVFAYNGVQGGEAQSVLSDSLQILVQTVAVDTSQAFKPIKGIMSVKGSWLDYIWYIIGAIVLIALGIFIAIYFIKNKKVVAPKPQGPVETLQERTLRLLNELEAKQLWQKKQVKEYYVALTDVVRNYIELRFSTPAMELTTDELLYKVQYHRELQPYHGLLSGILSTADLAKFAKAEPLPQEHMDAMEKAKQFVNTSKPVEVQGNSAAIANTNA
jgi:hypothetical protein